MKRRFVSAVLMALLAGCSSPLGERGLIDAAVLDAGGDPTPFPFGHAVVIGEPRAFSGPTPEGGGLHRLRGEMDADKAILGHHLVVTHDYVATRWRAWSRAVSDDGDNLTVVRGDRQAGACQYFGWLGCWHRETFAVALDDRLLRDRREDGLGLELLAEDGSRLSLSLSAERISEHLDAMAAVGGRAESK